MKNYEGIFFLCREPVFKQNTRRKEKPHVLKKYAWRKETLISQGPQNIIFKI